MSPYPNSLVFPFIPCKVLFSVCSAILGFLSVTPVFLVLISGCPWIFIFACVPVSTAFLSFVPPIFVIFVPWMSLFLP